MRWQYHIKYNKKHQKATKMSNIEKAAGFKNLGNEAFKNKNY